MAIAVAGCDLIDSCLSPGPILEAISGGGSLAVFFATGSTELSANAVATIWEAAVIAREPGASKVEIAGYTDRVGNGEANAALSRRRAEAVERTLLAFGVDKRLISPRVFGDKEWIIMTPPGVSEAQNRRVGIKVQAPSTAPRLDAWQLCPGGFRHVPPPG